MAEKKEKRYVSDNAQLMAEWDWERNVNISPSQVTLGSHTKVWWLGKCGHHWIADIKARNKGTGCPICDGKIVLPGFNDLQTTNPNLVSQWNWKKNTSIHPSQITLGSNKKVWWKCEKGHEWEASVKSRNRGTGCPICDGKTVLSGFNDLQTTNPAIVFEWDYERNLSLTPNDIAGNSHKQIWWICKKGHRWQASPNQRIGRGRNCPYCCHNPRVILGETDLLTVYPKIAVEWHPTKNGSLLPSQVTHNSSKRVWWKCDRGHEWQTAINHRANGSGCPSCAKSMQTSFPEQAIYYYVKKAYHDAINGYTRVFNNHGMELDIYIPSLNVGIEYDGIAFHRTQKHRQRELNKYITCQENNIMLIRIREDLISKVEDICDHAIFIKKDLNTAIAELSEVLPKLFDIDVIRDDSLIRAQYYSDLEKRSISYLYPQLAKEWNYSKNDELLPNMFLAHSNVKVWWICENGHEWQSGIDSRVRGNGCPYCSNTLVLAGYNDLSHKRPDLVNEWDFDKNDFSPSSITPGSGKKAWWICSSCGHRWLAEISSRNKGHGCPECAKRKRKKRDT